MPAKADKALDDSPSLSAAPAPRRGLRRLLSGNLPIAMVLFLAYLAIKLFVAEDLLKHVLRWIAGLGPGGPLIFIGLYIVAPVFFIPGVILSIGAGTVFGLLAGSIYV